MFLFVYASILPTGSFIEKCHKYWTETDWPTVDLRVRNTDEVGYYENIPGLMRRSLVVSKTTENRQVKYFCWLLSV